MAEERRSPGSPTGLNRHLRRAAARKARRKGKRGGLPAAGAALALSFGMHPSDAQANTFQVTSLNDSGAGTLRQAIADANANPDADVITFQTGLSGTITLTTGQLKVTESVEIDGPGSDVLAISGNDASRVLYLYNKPSAIDVTISGLTITGGHAPSGAGVINWGEHLTLDSVEIADNAATGSAAGDDGGGVWGDGPEMHVTIQSSLISGNSATRRGGGVYLGDRAQSVLIQDTKITGNQAMADGGGLLLGLYLSNGATIERSTISGNTANSLGGGIFLYAHSGTGPINVRQSTLADNSADAGGGMSVDAHGDDIVVQNCTISGNQATVQRGGGIYVHEAAGGFSIEHSTIAGNSATVSGGGAHVERSPVALDNSLIADNTAPTDADVSTANAGSFAPSYSLIETTGTAMLTSGAGNVLGQDPELQALADNGGATQTQMPALSSPAIDAGDPAYAAPPDVDQRGRPRVVGAHTDMGALELNAGTLQCAMANVSVSEDTDLVMLSVTRVGGSDGAASVDIATMDGTAKDGSDYTESMATLQWLHNDMAAKRLSVPINDDNLAESDETFTAALSNATGAALGATTSVTVTIDDDDEAPSISAIADQTIDENDSTNALKFKISDPDDDIADLVVSAKSSKHSLLADDDITLGGTGANRTATVKPLADKTGKVDVTLTVSDGTNSSTSTFTVTVRAVTEPVEPGPDAGMMEPSDAGAQAGTGGSGSGGNPSTGVEDASAGGSGGDDASTAAPGSDAGEADAGMTKSSSDDCGCSTVGASKRPSGAVIGTLLALFGAASRRRRPKLVS